jgi:FixJ family two-component response regulator
MPGFDGLKLQEELHKTLPHLSMVFITGHGSVPMSVEAMKGGAVDFLEKPVDDKALLAAIHRAAERSRALKASRDELIAFEWRYGRMTPRERQVFASVTAGFLNKQIAFDLGVAERTVKAHRARVMEKMEADSLQGRQRVRIHPALAAYLSRRAENPQRWDSLTDDAVCCELLSVNRVNRLTP